MATGSSQRGLVRAFKRWWPWLAGAAIVAIVAARIPVDAFRAALTKGPHATLAIVDLAITVTVLFTDSLSTWIGLIAARMRRPLRDVFLVRGATYLLFLLNYAVGQGGFGYYLYRTGTPPLRATGVTLFLIGTNLAMLLLCTTAAFSVHGFGAENATMWWTLVAGCIAFGVYLVVIALRWNVLARRELLAPLFDAGLRGHALALAGRLPHITVIVIGHWWAMVAWGIPVPFWTGIMLLPGVVIASVLPISPAGLGTAQAALVYFFQAYAVGATADDRAANMFAFGIVHFVYGVLASLLVGLVCAPLAKRISALATPADGTAAPHPPDPRSTESTASDR